MNPTTLPLSYDRVPGLLKLARDLRARYRGYCGPVTVTAERHFENGDLAGTSSFTIDAELLGGFDPDCIELADFVREKLHEGFRNPANG